MSMVPVDAEKYAELKSAVDALRAYRKAETGDGAHDPGCGWSEYDEAVADYRETISDAAENLVL